MIRAACGCACEFRGASRARSRIIIAALVLGSCASTHAAHSTRSTLAVGTSTSAPVRRVAVAQFSPAEARRFPLIDAKERASLALLGAEAPPTGQELAAALRDAHAMEVMALAHPEHLDASPLVRAEIAQARSVALRFHTAADAAAAGYVLASRVIPGIGAHWIRWSLVTEPFDASHPSMLLFAGNGLHAPLAGLSYYVRSGNQPAGFTDAGASWHRHVGLCIVNGRLVAESVDTRAACDHGNGVLVAGRDLWMLHVWVVPGYRNVGGTFAPVNAAVCAVATPC